MKFLTAFVFLNFILTCFASPKLIIDDYGEAKFTISPVENQGPFENDDRRMRFLIEHFEIEEEFRNQGHGRDLLLSVLERAEGAIKEDSHIEYVSLDAPQGSVSFWQHMGFELRNQNSDMGVLASIDSYPMFIPRERLSEVIENIRNHGNGLACQEHLGYLESAQNICSSLLTRGFLMSTSAIVFAVLIMSYNGNECLNFFGGSQK